MRKTPTTKESEIMALIIAGDVYADVSSKTGVPISTIKKIKQRNFQQLQVTEDAALSERTEEINTLLKRTNTLISRILDKAERGELEVSLNDLIKISNEMHRQNTINATPLRPTKTLINIAQKYQ